MGIIQSGSHGSERRKWTAMYLCEEVEYEIELEKSLKKVGLDSYAREDEHFTN